MASIKQLTERKYKITISNGYRNGKKICKSQTIQVPKSVSSRSIRQYVMHEAEELERRFKYGFSEDGSTTFQDYAESWLSRQSKYAPSTLASYRRQLEVVYPYIGAIPMCKLRPLAIENMLTQLRKRKNRSGQPIRETTVQHYLSAVSAVLSDAKRNEIIQKNPARMIDLPAASHTDQHIPTVEEAQHLLQALARELRHFRVFYLLAMATGCRRGELCALRWSDFRTSGNSFILTVSRSRSIVAGKGVRHRLSAGVPPSHPAALLRDIPSALRRGQADGGRPRGSCGHRLSGAHLLPPPAGAEGAGGRLHAHHAPPGR